jgi:hypothetical protein
MTVAYTMPVVVIPHSAARRNARHTGPETCGFSSSTNDVPNTSTFDWIVK